MQKKRIIDCIDDKNEYLIKIYSKILSKDPSSKVFVPLSDIYLKNKQIDDAAELCREGIKIYPTYVSARVMLGKIYFEAGMFSEARDQFIKATELSKDNLLSHKMLYKIYYTTSEDNLALKELKEIVRIDKRDKNFLEALAALEKKITDNGPHKDTTDTCLTDIPEKTAKTDINISTTISEKNSAATTLETPFPTVAIEDIVTSTLEIVEAHPQDKCLEDFDIQPYFISKESTEPLEDILFTEGITAHVDVKPEMNQINEKTYKDDYVINTLEKWLYNAKKIKEERRLSC